MLTQEEYVDVRAMHRQGLTNAEIAGETGYHPATIAKWLASGGPPERRQSPAEPVIDEKWAARIAELLRPAPKLLATSVFAIVAAEGFPGSYPSVARHLRELRGPRFRAAPTASVPIETAPGEEVQFDFSDVAAWTTRWGLGAVVLFGMIWCWSRWRSWWFTTSEDREHTFEGLVRGFEAAGGIPRVARTDRMGALGTSQGRRFRLHPPTLAFGQWHGCEIKGCAPRDAKRKGKVERPFRDAKEAFLTELDALGPPASIAELNERAAVWLAERVHARPHRTTGIPPAERLAAEQALMVPLPRRRFDTAYIESRRVHVAVPMIEWRGVRYSVPPACLGQKVQVRQAVDDDGLEVRWGADVVARHHVPAASSEIEVVWDAGHYSAAQAAALAPHRRHLTIVPDAPAGQPEVGRLELDGDYDVEPLDLARYALDGPHPPISAVPFDASPGRTAAGSERPEQS